MKDSNQFRNIFLRYIILFLLAIPNLFIFYYIFTPLTIYPLFSLFKLFYSPIFLEGATITIMNKYPLEIIGACVGGSAYYLLTMLNLSLPNIKFRKRMRMLLFSYASFWALNTLRIFLLGLLFVNESSSFDAAHRVFWYFGVTIFVVMIWFITITVFKIKDIPFYSDIKYIVRKIKR